MTEYLRGKCAYVRGPSCIIQDSTISARMEKLPKVGRGAPKRIKGINVWLLQRQEEDRIVRIVKRLALVVRIK